MCIRDRRNAFAVARYLSEHELVESVYYPGLPSHPQFDLAKTQMTGFGGIVGFVVKGGLEAAKSVVNSTELFQLGESLGGVKSLICHPATMTPVSYTHLDVYKRQGFVR